MTIPEFTAEASLGKMRNSYALTLGRKWSVPEFTDDASIDRARVYDRMGATSKEGGDLVRPALFQHIPWCHGLDISCYGKCLNSCGESFACQNRCAAECINSFPCP
jgi:hypothetical protein